MKTADNNGIAQQGFRQYCLNMFLNLWPRKWKCNLFVKLWHACYTKSCVKKFGGGKINKIYSGTISCADVNMLPHCLTSENKHAIKLTMQSTDDVYNIQHRLVRYILIFYSCILIQGLPILVWD